MLYEVWGRDRKKMFVVDSRAEQNVRVACECCLKELKALGPAAVVYTEFQENWVHT